MNEMYALAAQPAPLLEVSRLSVDFTTGRGRRARSVPALKDVSFTVPRGQTVALVGESGSGKSTIARVICGLHPDYSGEITFDGQPMTPRRSRVLWRQVQMVFQDPYGSLDPRMSVGRALSEILRYHRIVPASECKRRVDETLELVKLPRSFASKLPSEMSGGQRQRVAIARALIVEPRLLIADEAVSALDVSVQSEILTLLQSLRDELDLTILFISHDLAVVKSISDQVVVIRYGELVEEQPTDQLFDHPRTAYTKQLIASAPRFASKFLDEIHPL